MKLTKLGATVAVVLSISPLAATAASAAQYKSASSLVNLIGAQNGKHKFTVEGQTVECTNAKFTRTSLNTPSNDISGVTAAYGLCTAFGFAATVRMGTCTYNFDTPNAGLTATIDLVCNNNENVNTNPNTGEIRIETNTIGSECVVHIDTQNNKSQVTFANNTPAAGKVRVGAAVNALTAQIERDNGLCPFSGTGFTNNATYSGNTDVEGGAGVALEVG